jgi:hypothetical protein
VVIKIAVAMVLRHQVLIKIAAARVNALIRPARVYKSSGCQSIGTRVSRARLQ